MKNHKRHGKKGPNQIFHYSPVEETTLLPFLYTILAPKSKSDIKSMLAHHHVAVNGQPLTQFDTPLTPRDKVSVNFTRPFAVLRASSAKDLLSGGFKFSSFVISQLQISYFFTNIYVWRRK